MTITSLYAMRDKIPHSTLSQLLSSPVSYLNFRFKMCRYISVKDQSEKMWVPRMVSHRRQIPTQYAFSLSTSVTETHYLVRHAAIQNKKTKTKTNKPQFPARSE